MGEDVRLTLTTRALKTIKKVTVRSYSFVPFLLTRFGHKYGGLDNYLLNTKADFLGQEGMRLRVLVREQRNLKALENAKKAL